MGFNIPYTDKKRVVIIGGGFGGLKLAEKLKKSKFQVVLIDKNNYHQFPPLLYQVASSGLEYNEISLSISKDIPEEKELLLPVGRGLWRQSERAYHSNLHRRIGI